MFQLLVNAMTAWNQAGLLAGAAIMAAFGTVLLGYELRWRFHAQRVTGAIIGVRPSERGTYFPVYRYQLPDGTTCEATSDTGSSATSGMATGRTVSLMVFANHPDMASDANGYVGEAIGIVLLVIGGTLGYVALTAWPVTPMTWVMLGGIVLYGATKIRKLIPPRDQRPVAPAWRNWQAQKARANDVRPIEEITSAADLPAQRAKQRKTNRILAPVGSVVGITLCALSVHLGQTVYGLQTHGQRASGTVMRLEADHSSDRSSYYPVVRFVTGAGTTREFRDSIGSNPPSYHSGDSVTVLYLDRAAAAEPIIDRGFWNWLAPVAAGGFGLVLTALGVGAMRALSRSD
jgi:hypothetical protein